MTYGIFSLTFLKTGKLPLEGGDSENTDLAYAISHELLRNGYKVDETTFSLLETTDADTLTQLYAEMSSVFDELLSTEKFVPLYESFPNIPQLTNSEHRVNAWKALIGEELKVQELKAVQIPDYKIKDVAFVSRKHIGKLFQDVLYANQSPSKLDTELINWCLLMGYGFEYSKIKFKETAAYVGKYCFDNYTIPTRNATDILRIYSLWSGGDPGLKENTKFVQPNEDQKIIMRGALNRSFNLEESFKTYPEKWKRAIFYLNPGAFESKYPTLYKYADLLRNDPKQLKTFNGRVEMLIKNKDNAIFALLRKRRGVFARRLNHLIEVFGLPALEEFLSLEHEPKRLIELYNYFEGRRTVKDRSAILASQKSSQMVSYGKQRAMDNDLIDSIKETLLARIPKTLMGKIAIHPKLYYRALSTNNRATSVGIGIQTKGTCIQIEEGYIRTFVHWGRRGIDIDYSGFLWNAKTGAQKKVGWNGSHSEPGIRYSGDNRGRAAFNAEYIDVDLNQLEDYEWLVLDAVIYAGANSMASIPDTKFGYGVSSRPFGTGFKREQITMAQTITAETRQVWLYAIHIPSRTLVTMDFTKSGSNVTSSPEAVISWLDQQLVVEMDEIDWSILRQGHVLHLLAEEVVTDPEEASKYFTEDTTSEEVASLI